MKLSIITPSLNQGKFIRQCIESVLNQDYDDVEHIIIDGGSNDETHSIINEYKHLIVKIEKDSGPASAINKGFHIAKGQIIAWLNSDDYFNNKIFGKIVNTFKVNYDAEFVFGNLTFVDIDCNIIFKDKSRYFDHNSLVNISPDIRQPSSFFKADILKRVGYLNENLKIVFDYDLFIKLTELTKPLYIDENISFYRDYPETITRKNIRKQAVEIFKVSQLHGGKLLSPVSKLALKRILKGKL